MSSDTNDEPSGPWWRRLGPGLITGMADDDPSGIATFSQSGAQFGYAFAWSTLLTLPLMVAIQLASARIGRITGQGLVENLMRVWPVWLIRCVVALLAVANVVNLGADLNAAAEVTGMVFHGGGKAVYAFVYALGSLLLIVFVPYRRYVNVLKWLSLSTLSYVGVAIAAHVDWPHALQALVWPHVVWHKTYVTTLVAILGTTISPYLFFWQAEQEVEEIRRIPQRQPLCQEPAQARAGLRSVRMDTLVGMVSSNLIAYFMIVAAAATLHAHGITHIETTTQAAQALQPIAGRLAFGLFACGIIGTGLLAMPVLAGSLAYAVSGLMGIRQGLDQAPGQAKAFYGVLASVMVGGLIVSLLPISPIHALYWAAVINAVVAVPVMVAVMRLASNAELMHGFALPAVWRYLGWAATVAMGLATVAMWAAMLW
ncbi:MAG: divalent metal cation transporter [Aquabacterium sp.]